MQLEAVPSVNTSFPTAHAMVTQISTFGVVEENIASSLGVRPVITSLDCEETMIKIKWELTNDEYGIDPDTVKSIRIEWVEVNEDDLMDDLQASLSGMFAPDPMSGGSPISPMVPFQSQAMPGTPGSVLSPHSLNVMTPMALNRAISAPSTPQHHAVARSVSMSPQLHSEWEPDLMSTMANIPELTPEPDEHEQHEKGQSAMPKQDVLNLSTRRKGRSMTLDRWMSKQLDFSLYGATNNEHEVNARK